MSGGYSTACNGTGDRKFWITIRDETVSLPGDDFDHTVTPQKMADWAKEVMKVFDSIRYTINSKKSNDLNELDEKVRWKWIKNLAQWGNIAYNDLFNDKASKTLYASTSRGGDVFPIIKWKFTPFPWEVLYDQSLTAEITPDNFWGFKTAITRVLPFKSGQGPTPYEYPSDTILDTRMLLFIHSTLGHAINSEYDALKNLIGGFSSASGIHRFSEDETPGVVLESEIATQTDEFDQQLVAVKVINYMDSSPYNIFHFACHAEDLDSGLDRMRFTWFPAAPAVADSKNHQVSVTTAALKSVAATFSVRPLIFLNACTSAGGNGVNLPTDENFPNAFIKRFAAAVIATACPVPDIFAAEFAQVFYSYFFAGRAPGTTGDNSTPMAIADALQATRRYFWDVYKNPMGLAYGLYGTGEYKVAPRPVSGGPKV